MIRIGNQVTFEHAERFAKPGDIRTGDRKLVIVWFDGEPELWTVPCITADSNEEYSKGIAEIKEYYQHDWRGTERNLPMNVLTPSDYYCIQC